MCHSDGQRGRKLPSPLLFLPVLILSLSNGDSIRTAGIATETSVVFNTRCAQCHEGECSGRLSFDTGSRTAARHIRHYARNPKLSPKKIGEFFALLNYMKEHCALYLPEMERGKAIEPSRFALPSKDAYFIPLGSVKPGNYRLVLELSNAVPFHLEILSETLDNLLDGWVESPKRSLRFRFHVNRSAVLFVRIRSREAVPLKKLWVSAIETEER